MENVFAINCLVAFVVILVQAFAVLIKGKDTPIAKIWFLGSVLVAMLSWGLWGMITSDSYSQAIFYRYILNVGVIFSPIFFFKFITILLEIDREKDRQFRIFSIVGIFLLISGFFPFFRKSLYELDHGFNFWNDLSILYILCFVFLVFLFSYSLLLALKRYKDVSGVVKNQIRYIVPFTALGLLGAITSFWPFLIDFFPFGNLLWALTTVVVAFALLKYPLPSGRKVIFTVYVYLFIAVFIFLSFHFTSFLNEGYLGGFYTNEALMVGAFLALVFSLLLLPFLRYVQETADILFFQGKNPYKVIESLSLKFNNTLRLKPLLKTINKEFQETIRAEKVGVVVFDPDDEKNVRQESSFPDLNIKRGSPITNIRKLKVLGNIKEKDKSLKAQMDKYGIKIVTPLFFKGSLLGLVLLGSKHPDQGYTEEDLDFVNAIVPQMAIAIHNAFIYEKIENLNKNLEAKIEEKTADIKEKNRRLEKMLATQSEFLDIAGHQLRTPVSVIKGMLSMVDEGKISQKKKEEFMQSILQNAFKLEEIVETMLTASEVDSGNFGFDLEPVQLKPLLRDVYEKQKGSAKEKKLKFKMDIPNKYILPVLSNRRYLKHVLEKLVNNAFQYTKKGEVVVKVRPGKNKVDIDVSDTGIGVPKKEIPNLFEKFNRAKNATDVYGNGSGLGLFVVKKIIDAHTQDASIYVKESKLNKGTTFTLSLPTVKNS